MDITTVLLCLQSLLDDQHPFQKSRRPGQEKNNSHKLTYNEVIEYDAINTLLIKNLVNTPYGFDIFHEDMKNAMEKNKNYILIKPKTLKEKIKEKKKQL